MNPLIKLIKMLSDKGRRYGKTFYNDTAKWDPKDRIASQRSEHWEETDKFREVLGNKTFQKGVSGMLKSSLQGNPEQINMPMEELPMMPQQYMGERFSSNYMPNNMYRPMPNQNMNIDPRQQMIGTSYGGGYSGV